MQLILASNSPRRAELIDKLGFSFDIKRFDFDESIPPSTRARDTAKAIALKKASQIPHEVSKNACIITADTTVVLNGIIFGKPKDKMDAQSMLQKLSGQTHEVITGVTLTSNDTTIAFDEITEVKFKELSASEIDSYIEKYKPFDKAGAYGIQEWIGMIGIEWMKGCYYNVMGLPTQRTFLELTKLGF